MEFKAKFSTVDGTYAYLQLTHLDDDLVRRVLAAESESQGMHGERVSVVGSG